MPRELTLPLLFLLSLLLGAKAGAQEPVPTQTVSGVEIHRQAASAHFELWSGVAGGPAKVGSVPVFLSEMERAYGVINEILPDPLNDDRRKARPIRIVLVTDAEMLGISDLTGVKAVGYIDIQINRAENEDLLFLNPLSGLDESAVYRTVHEIQHLFLEATHPGEELWLNEGLSELLAWRVTGLEPLVSTDAFLGHGGPLPLTETNRDRFGIENYGQSYLFLRHLWEIGEGDAIFSAIAHEPGRGAPGLVHALSPAATAAFSELYRDFAFTLLIPGTATTGSIGWRTHGFTLRVALPKSPNSTDSNNTGSGPVSGVLPGGSSFALTEIDPSSSSPQVLAPSPLEAFLVEETQKNQVQFFPLTGDFQQDPTVLPQRAFILILNGTTTSVAYQMDSATPLTPPRN